jgi:hypothetical protein
MATFQMLAYFSIMIHLILNSEDVKTFLKNIGINRPK